MNSCLIYFISVRYAKASQKQKQKIRDAWDNDPDNFDWETVTKCRTQLVIKICAVQAVCRFNQIYLSLL